jgi:aminoglycoside 6'-N-acetyltransferase I
MEQKYEIKPMDKNNVIPIKDIFFDVFSNEPWNDDWSDENQLYQYLMDTIGNKNSLSLGLFDKDDLLGISLGSIIHWCSGTEYYIREFCIKRTIQHQGIGTIFLKLIEEYLLNNKINSIILSTEIDTPAYHFYRSNSFNELPKSRFFHKDLR